MDNTVSACVGSTTQNVPIVSLSQHWSVMQSERGVSCQTDRQAGAGWQTDRKTVRQTDRLFTLQWTGQCWFIFVSIMASMSVQVNPDIAINWVQSQQSEIIIQIDWLSFLAHHPSPQKCFSLLTIHKWSSNSTSCTARARWGLQRNQAEYHRQPWIYITPVQLNRNKARLSPHFIPILIKNANNSNSLWFLPQ